MKRYYIIHKSDWDQPVQYFYEKGVLGSAFQGKGCCWFDLADGFRLVSGDFANEDREGVWNAHPAVTHLHHPVKDKERPLADLLSPEFERNRFSQRHLDLLSPLGVSGADTLVGMNQKVALFHPGCCIYDLPKTTNNWIY